MSAEAFDALTVIDALNRHDVEFVAVGGWAALQHGARRLTDDLDICPQWSADNLERLAAALRELGAEILIAPGETVSVPAVDGVLISRMEIGNWQTRAGGVDILKAIPNRSRDDVVGFDELVKEAVTIEVTGRSVTVATLAALIRSKQVAGRPKDRQALPELERLLKFQSSGG